MVRAIAKFFWQVYGAIFYRIKLVGKENIPAEGPAIICANHVHWFDSISYITHEKRMVYVMGKAELFSNKFLNWFMRKLGVFPVKRGTGDTRALDVAKEILRNGELMLIFPEGTRNGMAKGVKMKKGAAMIALGANVPIIPIGVQGNFKLFSKVVLNIGKPITLENYATGENLNPREIVVLTQDMQSKIVELRDTLI